MIRRSLLPFPSGYWFSMIYSQTKDMLNQATVSPDQMTKTAVRVATAHFNGKSAPIELDIKIPWDRVVHHQATTCNGDGTFNESSNDKALRVKFSMHDCVTLRLYRTSKLVGAGRVERLSFGLRR